MEKVLKKTWKEWELKELLGEGAFAKVYRIERKDQFGDVYEAALKVISIPKNQSEMNPIINIGMDEKETSEYFFSVVREIVKEIKVMSRLKGNSAIVSYEDHAVVPFEQGVGWYILIRMELLTPLFDYMNQNSISKEDIIRMGIELCQALELCEKYQIIHRDIKPENIFVSKIGQYKLGDFGISRQMEKTSQGFSRKGTFTYMAPEVYKGEEYDQTADIYSLGIVLYRFLNHNRTPFLPPYPEPIRYTDKEKADGMRMNGAVMSKPDEGKGRLGDVILKACSYRQKDRYANAALMRKGLEDILENGEESCLKDEASNRIPWKPERDGQEKSLNFLDFENTDDRRAENTKSSREENRQSEDKIEKETAPNEKTKEKKGKRIWISFCLIFLLAGCIYFGYRKSLERQIPKLYNLTLEEASRKAAGEDESLIVKTKKEIYSEEVEKGRIISQDKEPGTVGKKGDVIEVVISKGALKVVPLLKNKSVSEAEKVLRKEGLILFIQSEQYSDQVKKDNIISQNPEKGTKLEEGEQVEVVISKGIEQVTVPNAYGISLRKAKEKMKKAKLQISEIRVYSDEVEEGYIVSQSIPAGQKVDKNTTVELEISLGKKPEPENKPSSSTSSQKSDSKKESSDLNSWDLVN